MTKMTDIDGRRIPDDEGWPCFNLTLHQDGMLLMRAPSFSTTSGDYVPKSGVLEVSLRAVFDEFLANKAHLINYPSEPHLIAELLREYVDKFHNMATLVAASPIPAPPTAEDLLNFKIAGWSIGDFQGRRSVNHGEEDGN